MGSKNLSRKQRNGLKAMQEKGKKNRLRPEQVEVVLGDIVCTTDCDRLQDRGLVVEAATEDLKLMNETLTRLGSIVGEQAIIASSSSDTMADIIVSHPERTAMTQLFVPAWRRRGSHS